jgi:hypothetical protein
MYIKYRIENLLDRSRRLCAIGYQKVTKLIEQNIINLPIPKRLDIIVLDLIKIK